MMPTLSRRRLVMTHHPSVHHQQQLCLQAEQHAAARVAVERTVEGIRL